MVSTHKRKDIRYNLYNAIKVENFIKNCKHYKTKIGQPFILEDWQKFFVYNVYGWERWSEEAQRWVFRFNECVMFIGKKNGKTSLASALAAYDCLIGEPTGAEVYMAACTRDQAKIAWSSTEAFINRNEALRESFTIVGNTIFANGSDRTSFIKPFGEDSNKEGLNVFSAIIDELHQHRDASVYTDMLDGMVGRQHCHAIIITTAGNDVFSFCKKQQDR